MEWERWHFFNWLLSSGIEVLCAVCVSQNLYVETLTTHVTVFGNWALKEVIMVKWGHKSGVLIL